MGNYRGMYLVKNIQVVVLLGGLGTRLQNETMGQPKCMVDVCGKPFFYHQLELMKWYGFHDFLFCTGFGESSIKKFFGNGDPFGIKIQYSSDGPELLGTGGAIRKTLPLLKEDFLVIYGDSYMDINYPEVIHHYFISKIKGKKAILTILKNNNKFDKSNIMYKDDILLYDKKNSSGMEYIDYGISILNRSIIEKIPENSKSDLADIYHEISPDIEGHEVKNRFYEIGTPQSLTEFRKFMGERLNVKKPAIFLDRDGTLNEIVINENTGQTDSPKHIEELKILPGVEDALKILQSKGYYLIITTNQPSAAKGKAPLEDLYNINNHLQEKLAKKNIFIDDILMCPHYPNDHMQFPTDSELVMNCECRKPKSGLIKKGIDKFNVNTTLSFMVGDSYVDIIAGKTAGLKTVFLGKFKCDSCQLMGDNKPDFIFKNLYEFSQNL